MHQKDLNYNTIVSGDYSVETRLLINNVIYGEDLLMSASTSRSAFKSDTPTVGGCISGELDATIIAESQDIPKMAEVIPQVRIYANAAQEKVTGTVAGAAIAGVSVVGSNSGTTSTSSEVIYSDWISKGHFFIDTRDVNPRYGTVSIHAYDKIMAMEKQYTISQQVTDTEAVNNICNEIGVSLRSDTRINRGYTIPVQESATSIRTVMGNIAAAYAGNWIISDDGELQLIQLNALPDETYYLIDNVGNAVTYGGDRIVLG